MKLEVTVFRAAPEALGPYIKLLEVVHIMGVFHFSEQLFGWHLLVALKNERVYLHTFTLIDVESKHNIVVTSRGVRAKAGVDLHIGETFVGIVGTSLVDTGLQHILRNHIADMDAKILAQFVGVVAADAIETDSGKFRTTAEHYLQEHLIVLDSGKEDLHIIEKPLLPEIIDGCRYFVARYFDDIADLETCDKQYHTLVQIVIIIDSYTSDFVCLRSKIVNIIIPSQHHLSLSVKAANQEEGKSQ